MRENRPSGSEGGAGSNIPVPTPIDCGLRRSFGSSFFRVNRGVRVYTSFGGEFALRTGNCHNADGRRGVRGSVLPAQRASHPAAGSR